MLVILDDITFLCQIHGNLKDPFTIGIQGQLKNHHQVQDFSNDHAKFKFQDVLFYHDGLLYVPDGLTQFQILQIKHDALAIGHFGFNETMELVFRFLVATTLEIYERVH